MLGRQPTHSRLTRRGGRALGALTAALLGVPMALIGSGALSASATSSDTARSDTTSAVEVNRVDQVPTPKIGWYDCYGRDQCATVNLPLDYDHPFGAKVQIAVLRVKARDQKHRIGSLFLNPGGPGGSGTAIADAAPFFLGSDLLDRFDIVGFDPRGTNFSDQVKCFTSVKQQTQALRGFIDYPFPYTKAEELETIASARATGKACSSTGEPLSASMSTAEVARDMDVLRRAVGDAKLSYLGFSYGTYLGQVYANLFPDRVRAITIDGNLDPIAWAGRPSTADVPVTDRLRSADGSWKAMHEILVRCKAAGKQACPFAPGNPVANFDLIAQRLKVHPLVFTDDLGNTFRYTYAVLIADMLGALYDPSGYLYIADQLANLLILTAPTSTPGAARQALLAEFSHRLAAHRAAQRSIPGRFDFPYDNFFEAFSSVLCTDSLNPPDAADWPAAADASDRRAKYFGRLWIWEASQCASQTWTATDEDAYRGPFTGRTSAPVLVVGDYWDPATNYRGSVKVASLLPNSRLLSSDSWGHTAYGTSSCVTDAVDTYLVTQATPPANTVCIGDVQPFQTPPAAASSRTPNAGRQLPPVRPPVPSLADLGA